jgi:hypothetical protein
MKNFTTCICIMGLSGVATADIMWDQIGEMDGSSVNAGLMACQDFEADYDIYDIVAADNFTGDGSAIEGIEMVVGGYNGFVDPSSITGYTVNLYSSADAAGASLTGDIDSNYIDAADVTLDADWMGANFLISMSAGVTSAAGEQLLGIIPANEVATGGQTACDSSFLGDDISGIQANPAEGFGFGPWQAADAEFAYRIGGYVAGDPCDSALPANCAADVDMDGSIAVSDVLAIIGQWGTCGDGTVRPSGDVAPLPNGDCCVTVADVLAVVGSWGADCTVYGACCYADETCGDISESDCSAAGGSWNGGDSVCSSTNCVIAGGDECASALVAAVGATAFDTTIMTPSGDEPTDELCSGTFLEWGGSQDVWLMYVSEGGLTTFNTCDAGSYDTSMALYEGTCDNLIACNGDGVAADGACQQYYSEITLVDCVAGETYYIRIGGWQGATGAGNLNIIPPLTGAGACCFTDESCLELEASDCDAFGGVFQGVDSTCEAETCGAPAGDECSSASAAFEGANAFDTTFATSSTPDPDDSMCPGEALDWQGSPDVWMAWVASSSGVASFTTCDTASYDTSMVIYGGSCDNQIACNGDTEDGADGAGGACQPWYSQVNDVPVTAGETYYIRLGGWQGEVGAGTLTISTGSDAAAACCYADGSCADLTAAACANAGGTYDGSSMCADGNCLQPFGCPAGADQEGDPCQVDSTEADSNCGLNCDPPVFGDLSLGVPVCGNASIMADLGTRDTDWYYNADLNAGGDFTISAASSGSVAGLAFGIVDNIALVFVEVAVTSTEGSITFSIAPGDYSVFVAQNAFDTANSGCGSGTEEYWVMLESSVATSGACCFTDLTCADLSATDCAAAGGSYDGSQDCSTAVCSAAASGDECVDAITVMDGANAFDTSVMTASQPQPDEAACTGPYAMDWNSTNDGWYMYVATGGMTTFDTCDGASFDTSIVLYEDTCDNQVACNGDIDADPAGCQAYSSIIEYNCVAGATYYVRIGEWNGGIGGAGTLNIN